MSTSFGASVCSDRRLLLPSAEGGAVLLFEKLTLFLKFLLKSLSMKLLMLLLLPPIITRLLLLLTVSTLLLLFVDTVDDLRLLSLMLALAVLVATGTDGRELCRCFAVNSCFSELKLLRSSDDFVGRSAEERRRIFFALLFLLFLFFTVDVSMLLSSSSSFDVS